VQDQTAFIIFPEKKMDDAKKKRLGGLAARHLTATGRPFDRYVLREHINWHTPLFFISSPPLCFQLGSLPLLSPRPRSSSAGLGVAGVTHGAPLYTSTGQVTDPDPFIF
jgi:hypothetical protein